MTTHYPETRSQGFSREFLTNIVKDKIAYEGRKDWSGEQHLERYNLESSYDSEMDIPVFCCELGGVRYGLSRTMTRKKGEPYNAPFVEDEIAEEAMGRVLEELEWAKNDDGNVPLNFSDMKSEFTHHCSHTFANILAKDAKAWLKRNKPLWKRTKRLVKSARIAQDGRARTKVIEPSTPLKPLRGIDSINNDDGDPIFLTPPPRHIRTEAEEKEWLQMQLTTAKKKDKENQLRLEEMSRSLASQQSSLENLTLSNCEAVALANSESKNTTEALALANSESRNTTEAIALVGAESKKTERALALAEAQTKSSNEMSLRTLAAMEKMAAGNAKRATEPDVEAAASMPTNVNVPRINRSTNVNPLSAPPLSQFTEASTFLLDEIIAVRNDNPEFRTLPTPTPHNDIELHLESIAIEERDSSTFVSDELLRIDQRVISSENLHYLEGITAVQLFRDLNGLTADGTGDTTRPIVLAIPNKGEISLLLHVGCEVFDEYMKSLFFPLVGMDVSQVVELRKPSGRTMCFEIASRSTHDAKQMMEMLLRKGEGSTRIVGPDGEASKETRLVVDADHLSETIYQNMTLHKFFLTADQIPGLLKKCRILILDRCVLDDGGDSLITSLVRSGGNNSLILQGSMPLDEARFTDLLVRISESHPQPSIRLKSGAWSLALSEGRDEKLAKLIAEKSLERKDFSFLRIMPTDYGEEEALKMKRFLSIIVNTMVTMSENSKSFFKIGEFPLGFDGEGMKKEVLEDCGMFLEEEIHSPTGDFKHEYFGPNGVKGMVPCPGCSYLLKPGQKCGSCNDDDNNAAKPGVGIDSSVSAVDGAGTLKIAVKGYNETHVNGNASAVKSKPSFAFGVAEVEEGTQGDNPAHIRGNMPAVKSKPQFSFGFAKDTKGTPGDDEVHVSGNANATKSKAPFTFGVADDSESTPGNNETYVSTNVHATKSGPPFSFGSEDLEGSGVISIEAGNVETPGSASAVKSKPSFALDATNVEVSGTFKILEAGDNKTRVVSAHGMEAVDISKNVDAPNVDVPSPSDSQVSDVGLASDEVIVCKVPCKYSDQGIDVCLLRNGQLRYKRHGRALFVAKPCGARRKKGKPTDTMWCASCLKRAASSPCSPCHQHDIVP